MAPKLLENYGNSIKKTLYNMDMVPQKGVGTPQCAQLVPFVLGHLCGVSPYTPISHPPQHLTLYTTHTWVNPCFLPSNNYTKYCIYCHMVILCHCGKLL